LGDLGNITIDIFIRAKFCALTKERLRNPIAVCRLGYLYNYENLIKLMMERKMPTEFMHIRKVGVK